MCGTAYFRHVIGELTSDAHMTQDKGCQVLKEENSGKYIGHLSDIGKLSVRQTFYMYIVWPQDQELW